MLDDQSPTIRLGRDGKLNIQQKTRFGAQALFGLRPQIPFLIQLLRPVAAHKRDMHGAPIISTTVHDAPVPGVGIEDDDSTCRRGQQHLIGFRLHGIV